MNHNYELNLNDHYGVAGFEEMADSLATRDVPQWTVRYVLQGIVTARADKPVTARKLVDDVYSKYNTRISDATVRKIVSECRADKRWPIASGPTGYYLALKAEQLDGTIEHLTRRINREVVVVQELKEVQRTMRQREIGRAS